MKRRITISLILCSALAWQPVAAAPFADFKMEVRGVKGVIQKNVESRLAIERRELEAQPSAQAVQNFSKTSLLAVRDAVAPYGYYQPQIATRIEANGKVIKLIYVIETGVPVRVASVNVKVTGAGEENSKIKLLVKKFPLKNGDIFNSITYSAARDKLFDVVNNQGYVKADIEESKVIVNTDSHTAVIKLIINTKERYYFGRIHFNRNAYDPEFMKRFDLFGADEPFSSNKLLAYQQDMNNSRYFKQVIVIPDLEHAEGQRIPLEASIVPVNYRRYAFGIGYGTFTGPRLTAGVNLKRITNTGHSLDALLKLSSVLSGIALKYSIPGTNPLTEQWNIGANYQKFVPKKGNRSYSKNVSLGYTWKKHHWTLASNVNYLWERYQVNYQPSRTSHLLYPNLSLAYLKTDNIVKPTYGRALTINLQGASSNILSSTSFLQGEVKGKLFMTPFSFGHLILRGDLGYTVVHDLMDLPLSMRFFAGGMTSIRGYPDQSIGPGKYLGVASIEYRQHIAYDVSGAVFYDMGTATNHIDRSPANRNSPGLYRGAGVGLVYESMIGPIKLYVGRGLSKKDEPYQVEFALGPEF